MPSPIEALIQLYDSMPEGTFEDMYHDTKGETARFILTMRPDGSFSWRIEETPRINKKALQIRILRPYKSSYAMAPMTTFLYTYLHGVFPLEFLQEHNPAYKKYAKNLYAKIHDFHHDLLERCLADTGNPYVQALWEISKNPEAYVDPEMLEDESFFKRLSNSADPTKKKIVTMFPIYIAEKGALRLLSDEPDVVEWFKKDYFHTRSGGNVQNVLSPYTHPGKETLGVRIKEGIKLSGNQFSGGNDGKVTDMGWNIPQWMLGLSEEDVDKGYKALQYLQDRKNNTRFDLGNDTYILFWVDGISSTDMDDDDDDTTSQRDIFEMIAQVVKGSSYSLDDTQAHFLIITESQGRAAIRDWIERPIKEVYGHIEDFKRALYPDWMRTALERSKNTYRRDLYAHISAIVGITGKPNKAQKKQIGNLVYKTVHSVLLGKGVPHEITQKAVNRMSRHALGFHAEMHCLGVISASLAQK